MSYSMTDPSGGYFDPNTGMYVPASNMPTKQQATAPNAFSGAANAIGNTLAPALMQGTNGAPPMPTPPAGLQQPPAAPPVQAALGPQGPQADPYASAPSPASQPGMAAAIAAAAKANPQPTAGATSAPAPGGAQPPPANQSPDSSGPRDYSGLTSLIVGPESGGNPNAKNPNSSARGLGQFIDPTWQQFINSAANTGHWTMDDRGNPDANSAAVQWYAGQNDSIFQKQFGRPATQAELLSSHFLGGPAAAALTAAPDADAYTTLKAIEPGQVDAVFSKNGKLIQKGMTGSQVLASTAGHFGVGPGSTGPMLAGTTTQPAVGPDQAQQPGQSGPGGYDPATDPAIARMKAMFQMSGVTPVTQSDKLLALASGLLSGPNFSQGAGKGLAAMGQVTQQQRAQALQMAQMGIESQYHDALMGLSGQRIGIQQQNANTGVGRLANQETATANRSNVPLQGQLAASKAGATEEAKANQEDIDSMLEAGANAQSRGMQLDQLQQLVQSGQAGTGPGLAAAKRGIANYFGVDMTPYGGPNASSSQLAQAIASQTRGSGIMGKNMRTQREFNTVMEGLPNMDQNPQALTGVISGLKNFNSYQTQAANNWLQLPQDQRNEMRGDQDKFQQWRMGQLQDWRSKVQQGGGLYGQGAATPGTTQTGETKGVAPTMRYDQASGQMVPM